jgi:hypothetical protein
MNPNEHKHDEAVETKGQVAGVDLILGVAPEGAEGLDGAGAEDVLMVEGRDGGADQGADLEDPLQVNRASFVLEW